MTSKKQSRGSGRTRNYATIVYPESAPENWKDILANLKICCFVSPLHDADTNPTGEPKKPHHHVVIMFDSVKTRDQASDVFKQFGGVGCEVVKDLRAYSRYLCHLDNPEKAQYNSDDVLSFGGADYRAVIGTMADKQKAIREMILYIEENDIVCFADLVMYASINNDAWFDALTNSCAYFIKEFIKSRTWKLHHVEEK